MQNPLDALSSCALHLVGFRARALKLQAETEILIEGSESALADSRRLIRQLDCDPAPPQPADEPSLAGSSWPPLPSASNRG